MAHTESFDVIVVGSGHAGIEAALAAAKLGCKTLMATINIDNIGLMPCNPSIGGPAKGQIVGEIDALGGEMGYAADATHIQLKILNRSRGPAVQCLRSQNDKRDYNQHMKTRVFAQSNLDVRQVAIDALLIENNIVKGCVTTLGKTLYATCVVITTGTFLNGRMHVGLQSFKGGRIGEMSSESLSDSFRKYLTLGRLKTGTPPRLDARSIDFGVLAVQPGDPEFLHFSFRTPFSTKYKDQVDCYLTRTTPETHKIILSNLDRSPMYTNVIQGVGPRYCPSIEDKVVRFADKESHQIFIEPEGRHTHEIYPQGLNTSLPEDVQESLLKSMPGLSSVKILKPGYAVEYDFVHPSQLHHTLETKPLKNLYLAGQINGTSGYEEAAGQGIIAGINAGLRAQNRPAFVLTREESYIGTMIDDLINKEIFEPYRMLTSRSEYRLLLRQDNATRRLSEKAHEIGMLTDDEIHAIRFNAQEIEAIKTKWRNATTNQTQMSAHKIATKQSLYDFIKRPEIGIDDIEPNIPEANRERFLAAATEIKYEGYLFKQQREVEKLKRLQGRVIPDGLAYLEIQGLRNECREKLRTHRPKTIGDAMRIAGVNPADIMIVIGYMDYHGIK